MIVHFFPRGRLGNAIFRYFACSLFCMKYEATYQIIFYMIDYHNISDSTFIEWMNADLQRYNYDMSSHDNIVFADFYQHDKIYKKYKGELIQYMKQHSEDIIATDGIFPGDGNLQKFFIKDILYEPDNYSKNYDTVIHIRLDDHVQHGLYIKIEYILMLLEKITDMSTNSCILVDVLRTDFEKEFIQKVVDFVYDKFGFYITIESNDILTDFHIMKNAKALICSTSTLSWTAAFLSDTIEKCYFPDHSDSNPFCSFKSPIDNTELYYIGF